MVRGKAHSILEIARALGAKAHGDVDLRVTGASEPGRAGAEDLALAMSPRYSDTLKDGRARAALLWEGADWQALGLEAAIYVHRPRLAMSELTRLLDPGPDLAPGIHPSAIVDPSAEIGPEAAIGPFVVIGRNVRIGPRARIASHVSIAEEVTIGSDALIAQGVRIGPGVTIGDRFICQPGASIGGDGFSFVTETPSGVEEVRQSLAQRETIKQQGWQRIHSIGSVTLGDDVEVGSNATIDRGTIRDTQVGSGTKIDNLVMIAHNVIIGRDVLCCSQVGIAGSSRIGDRVVLAGQVGVNDNITVGDDVIAGGASKIFTNAPAGRVLLGYPAMKLENHVESYKGIRRLPRLFAQVAELQKAVSKLAKSD